MSLQMTLIDHGDWMEGAEGPRQAGASPRAPRRGELDGGRRPPSCELGKFTRSIIAVLFKNSLKGLREKRFFYQNSNNTSQKFS